MKKNKMLLIVAILVVVAIIMVVIISLRDNNSVVKNNNEITNNTETSLANTKNNGGKINEDKYYIYQQDSYDLVYQAKSFSKKIRIPFINVNSEEAKKLNDELKKSFEEAKESVKSEGRSSFSYKNMNYEANVFNDELVSVIINEANQIVPGETINEYKVYNFDIETGKLLSNKETLEKINIIDLDNIIIANLTKEYNEGKQNMQDNPNLIIDIVQSYETLEELLSDIKYDIDTDMLYVVSDNTIRINIEMYDADSKERKEIMKELRTDINTNDITSNKTNNTVNNTIFSNEVSNSIANM